jgi:hypothetical protein
MGHGRFAKQIVIERPGRARPAIVWLARHALDPILYALHRPAISGLDPRLPWR